MSTQTLLSALTSIGSRACLHLPSKMSVSEGAQKIIQAFLNSNYLADDTELIVVSFRKIYIENSRIYIFQIAQLSQALLNVLLSNPNRIVIIEMASNLGQLQIPATIGRILTISTDYKTLKDFTETARFLSGPTYRFTEIAPLDLIRYYGQIGYLLSIQNAETFTYNGHAITIKMTSRQYQEYLERMQMEKQQARSQPFSTIQITNFVYPARLQTLHNIPRNKRPNITPDLPTYSGGWITSEIITDLDTYSPKLVWLIDYLKQNPGKHIIWTAFSVSNGVDVISSILQLAEFNTLTLSGRDSVRQRYQKLETFNQSENYILVTNLYAFSGLQNVRSVVFMDQHAYTSVFKSYLREIAITSAQSQVAIIFLIGIGPQQQQTVEVLNYRIMAQMLITTDTMLKILKTGQLEQNQLETYRQAFETPTLTLQDLQTAVPQTFQRISLE